MLNKCPLFVRISAKKLKEIVSYYKTSSTTEANENWVDISKWVQTRTRDWQKPRASSPLLSGPPSMKDKGPQSPVTQVVKDCQVRGTGTRSNHGHDHKAHGIWGLTIHSPTLLNRSRLMPKKMYFLKSNEIDSIKCNAYGILFYVFKQFLLEIPHIRGLNMKCPPQAYVFAYLVLSCLGLFGKVAEP